MSVHENSTTAYAFEADRMNAREQAIYDMLMRCREKLTDREIKTRLGYEEMNHVRPRITALLDRDWLIEAQPTLCRITRKTVRTCRALTEFERDQRISKRTSMTGVFSAQFEMFGGLV